MPIRDLVPWRGRAEGGHPLSPLRREMDRLFEDFFGDWDLDPFKGFHRAETPKVDVAETEKEVKITADLPGIDPKDVDISMSGNVLAIRGERREEKEDKGKDYHRVERWSGSFHRAITMPCEVNVDKVEATFKKGVLTVTLPKTAKAKRKGITVKVEEDTSAKA